MFIRAELFLFSGNLLHREGNENDDFSFGLLLLSNHLACSSLLDLSFMGKENVSVIVSTVRAAPVCWEVREILKLRIEGGKKVGESDVINYGPMSQGAESSVSEASLIHRNQITTFSMLLQ